MKRLGQTHQIGEDVGQEIAIAVASQQVCAGSSESADQIELAKLGRLTTVEPFTRASQPI